MAAIKMTITGVICDLYGRTISGPVKIVGEAQYTDLGVGGGPMPPGPGGGGGDGDHIWGPTDPRPSNPIANVPGIDNPDPPGFGLRPSHPIVLPEPPIDPPPVDPPTSPANPQWQWVYNRSLGWHPAYVPGPGDAQPH